MRLLSIMLADESLNELLDDLSAWFPDGPNFGAFIGIQGPFKYLLGLVLAVVVLSGIAGVITGFAKVAVASDNDIKRNRGWTRVKWSGSAAAIGLFVVPITLHFLIPIIKNAFA